MEALNNIQLTDVELKSLMDWAKQQGDLKRKLCIRFGT